MKILIIQLARLGDIYMTWPTVRALKRAYPQAEIHLLTRSRFKAAVDGLEGVDHHHLLNTAGLLEPLLNHEDLDGALGLLKKKIHALRSQNFDKIINLTFSPVSSYLTSALHTEDTDVRGYSRYADGTLRICDETSAYFYAEAGLDRNNRVHLTDLFAAIADVDYSVEDWGAPQINSSLDIVLPEKFAVLHIGASEAHKMPNTLELKMAVEAYKLLRPEAQVVLVGSSEEQDIAEELRKLISSEVIVDLVGKTSLPETFALLQEAELLIGGDSAPLHMAALTDTATLNLSKGRVNFYETGPKAGRAGVLVIDSEKGTSVEEILSCLKCLLEGELKGPQNFVRRSYESIESFECNNKSVFEWGLVKAIYLGQSFPIVDSMDFVKGAMELANINQFAIEQIQQIGEKGLQSIGPLLDSAEDVIQKISRLVPELSPMINWYNAEKVRIGPGSLEDICSATLNVHLRFARLLEAYVPTEALLRREEILDGTL